MTEQMIQKFELQKVYVKDLSFESPMAPDIFRSANTIPGIEIQLNVGHEPLTDDLYESLLIVTVNGKLDEKDAFLAEVHQAGIYRISGIDQDHGLSALLEVACPNMLFPFAREAINELVVRGGFPQLLLSPVNFETLYRDKLRSNGAGDGTSEPDDGNAAQPDAEGSST